MPKQKIKVFDSSRGYDLAARFYDKKEKYLNSFEKGFLIPLLGDVRDKKILDVGAGTGRTAIILSKAGGIVTAVDLSEKMLSELKKKSMKIETIKGDAERLPFDDNSFDIIVGAFLIVHLKDPKIFFKEAYRLLKDGGILAVTNINQKDPPPAETEEGLIKIESYYHRPEKIISDLKDLAFGIKENLKIDEKGVWINQIIIAQK